MDYPISRDRAEASPFYRGITLCAGLNLARLFRTMTPMRDFHVPKLAKWPFLLGDALLLATAVVLYIQSDRPVATLPLALIILAVAAGAALAILPFVLEYRVAARLAETDALSTTVAQVQKMETVAAQISSATGLWQTAQDAADKTAAHAKAIGERIAAEAKSFSEFLERANTGEKAALRLELDKLRRAEADWMQVLVRVLDHVYALHQGAVKSGQRNLVDQLGRFQHACYDAARRVGLAPFVAAPSERFNAERHQPVEGNGKVPAEAVIEETLASGYTYQGRIARPALVRVRGDAVAAAAPESKTPESAQGSLPLEKPAPGSADV